MNRRDFLTVASMACAAGAFAPVLAQGRKSLGVQLFSVPKMLAADFPGTLAFLARLGYTEVEFFGPYDFSTPAALAFWKSLEPMLGFSGSGFYGRSTQEVRSTLEQNKLTAPSMHTDLDTLQNRMGPLAEAAHAIGATYVVLPAIPEEKRKTVDDYKKIGEAFNSIGADALKHGVKFAYHNHGYGWHPVDGQIPMQVLLHATDPKKVFLEMDIFWTTAAGADPIQLLKDYPHRYKMMHLKDMKQLRRFKGGDTTISEMMELVPDMTSAGDGVLDLKGIVAQAKRSGVEHLFLEQDRVANPQVDLKRSADYLLQLV
jgi:sugar phosphate isomerase/epimerase